MTKKFHIEMPKFEAGSLPDAGALKNLSAKKGLGLGLFATSFIAFALSLTLALGLYWAEVSCSKKLEETVDRIEAHKTLKPIIQNLETRESELKTVLAPKKRYEMPDDVQGILKALRAVATDADLTNTQFLPDAVSVIGKNDIRLTGRASGTSDALRRFLVGLSSQNWITSIGHVKAEAGERSDAHVYEMTIRAKYGLTGEKLSVRRVENDKKAGN